jgi:ABC-type multidrug transport system fused ATPase/permease subunit
MVPEGTASAKRSMTVPVRQYWALMAQYLTVQKGRVAVLGVVLVGGIAMKLLNPQLLAEFIDTATAGSDANGLLKIALLYIGVAILAQGLTVAAAYLSAAIGWTATNALRIDLARHCLTLDLSFHKAHAPGELIERVDGDVNALSRFFSQFTIAVLGNALLLLGVAVALFAEDWRAGSAMAVFTAGTLLVLLRLRHFGVPYMAGWRQRAAEFYGFIGEQLSATEDIRTTGAKSFVMRRLYAILQDWLSAYHKSRLAYTVLWGSTIGLFALGSALALGIGAYLWYANAITIGTVFLIFNYFFLLQDPIDQIRLELEALQAADASILRIKELLATRSRLRPGGHTPLPAVALALTFDAVSFSYGDGRRGEAREWVLKEITFELPAGCVLGLLGRTGSGKSTLARLVPRLYDVQQGRILLSGVPLTDTPLSELRRRVGLVTQEVQLFHTTVRNNLTLFDAAVDDRRISHILEVLGLHGWLTSLPNGLDTELSPDGLSAGEAQLLAFARVFLRDPGLVILDEAASRLDPATCQRIERAVEHLLSGRTGMIIAHRLETVERADYIMILEQGRIVEYGAREALARAPHSRFAGLLKTSVSDVLV